MSHDKERIWDWVQDNEEKLTRELWENGQLDDMVQVAIREHTDLLGMIVDFAIKYDDKFLPRLNDMLWDLATDGRLERHQEPEDLEDR